MDFITEIQDISSELAHSSDNENQLKIYFQKIKSIIHSTFPVGHQLFIEINQVSFEPSENYFPEMYKKEKDKAIAEAKKHMLKIIKDSLPAFQKFILTQSAEQILLYGESQLLEFKSTLCWDIKNAKDDKKKMNEIVIKAIAAFSNSEGGVLIIGVDDNKKILGLKDDYGTFKNGNGSRDDFELHLTTLVSNSFSKTFAKSNLEIAFPLIDGTEICLIRVKASETPHILSTVDKNGLPKQKFFIRLQNSSRELEDILEIVRYVKKRFPNWN